MKKIKLRVTKGASRWPTIAFGGLTGLVYSIEFFSDGITKRALVLLGLTVLGYSIIPAVHVGKGSSE